MTSSNSPIVIRAVEELDSYINWLTENHTATISQNSKPQMSPEMRQLYNIYEQAIQLHNFPDHAINLYSKILNSYPKFVAARYNMACMLRQVGSLEDAIKHFSIASEYSPNDPSIFIELGATLNDRGLSLNSLGRYEEAIHFLEQALSINGNLENLDGMASNLLNLAVVFARQGKLFVALPLAQQSAQLWIQISHPMKEKAQEVIIQIKAALAFPLDVIIEKIQKVTSPTDLQVVFMEYPIMMKPDILDLFYEGVPDVVPPHARPAYKQHLEWLVPVVNSMTQSAQEVFFYQVNSLAKLHIAIKRFPFMINDRFIQIAEQVINEQIPLQDKPSLVQLLNWLKQVAHQG